MKKLNQLLNCDFPIDISGISTDSRNIEPGFLFIAIKGFHVDHYDYVSDAIDHGAVAVVVDRESNFSVPTIIVSDINETLISICEKFYDVKSDAFKFIGITGTDGKTTTSIITRNLLNLFVPTAYIGTNGLYCGNDIYPTNNTTPCIEELYRFFSVIREHKCKFIVMEVSSEAMLHHRVDSIMFDVIAFTNITEDHLNIHKTVENYINSKFRLTTLCKNEGKIFINGDDENCQMLSVNNKITFGFSSYNDYVISNVKECQKNVYFNVKCKGEKYNFCSPFLGNYNIYNVVLSWLIVRSFAFSDLCLISSIAKMPPVLGRRELFYDLRGFTVLLDYAHTENGILNLLQSLSHYRRIIVVTGAAGGREVEKRPRIGDILFQYADYIVFTMDDPRDEDPYEIALQMIGSHKEENYTFIRNRKQAISCAFSVALEGDVVAIIGKGRDNYMAIFDRRISYSDYEVIQKILQK